MEDINDLILVNNQLDAQFFPYMFISILYMFRATMCSSSGESVCINATFDICHSMQVTVWYAGMDRTPCCSIHTCIPIGHLHRVTYTKCCIDTTDSPDDEHMVARNIQSIEINIHGKNCASGCLFTRITPRFKSKNRKINYLILKNAREI